MAGGAAGSASWAFAAILDPGATGGNHSGHGRTTIASDFLKSTYAFLLTPPLSESASEGADLCCC